MPGLIAMTAVFVVVGIEMFFASKGAGHSHSTDFEAFRMEDQDRNHEDHSRPRYKRGNSHGRYSAHYLGANGTLDNIEESSQNLMSGRSPSISVASPLTPRAPPTPITNKEQGEDDDDSELGFDPNELGPPDIYEHEDGSRLLPSHLSRKDSVDAATADMTEAQHKKQLLQCLLLEAGILFHSVFIGMALSVATGTSFIVLLVAISFHQTFEGFALGSRISAIKFPVGSPKPWLMALAYGTTTPVGQAIGLAIHTLYDPASQTGLLTVGFMNAISSGLLLFAGLVELLAEDFLSDESYVTLMGKRRLQACGSVVGGALLMALVGAWA
jgi:zinc transporter 1/2/3